MALRLLLMCALASCTIRVWLVASTKFHVSNTLASTLVALRVWCSVACRCSQKQATVPGVGKQTQHNVQITAVKVNTPQLTCRYRTQANKVPGMVKQDPRNCEPQNDTSQLHFQQWPSLQQQCLGLASKLTTTCNVQKPQKKNLGAGTSLICKFVMSALPHNLNATHMQICATCSCCTASHAHARHNTTPEFPQ